MSENEKMRTVECTEINKCDCVFEIPESNIKAIVRTNLCALYEDAQCPKCGKKRGSFYDHEICENQRQRDRLDANSPVACPICDSTQIHASDKGFSTGKALVGGALLGTVGLLAGNIGSKKVIITCLKCGNKWNVN